MAFTAKDVQALREKTGCGMMDCKKALVATDGNMDAAVDFLREKGLASQAKKADRIAAEGTVCAIVDGNVGAVIEMNAETDFVSNGEPFKALAEKITKIVIEKNPADLDALLKTEKDGQTVEEMVQELFLALRENIKVRRFERYEGKVVSYVHGGGKIGVLVNFDTDIAADNAELIAAGKNIAMQIAAMNPAYLDEASVLRVSFFDVALTLSPLKLADSMMIVVVSSSISELRPPITPAIAMLLSASLIISMSLVISLSFSSRVVNLSPSAAFSTMILLPFT